MKITAVYGSNRKGCTYHMAQEVISRLEDAEVAEFFLPEALPEFCTSCFRCFGEEISTCPHSRYTAPLRAALLDADLILLTSPVYSFHVTGQMKVFLDHFANMWMVHRPEPEMFRKQGVVVAAASGPVFAKTLDEMKDSLDFWGVARTYKLGAALFESRWDSVPQKAKVKIAKKAERIAAKILRGAGRATPAFRVRKWFFVSRMMQSYVPANPVDAVHWQEQGWLDGKKPWKP